MDRKTGNKLSTLKEQNISPTDILNEIRHSIIVTDLNGRILYWNKGAERLFGYVKEEIVNKNGSILYPRKRKENFASDIKKLNKGENITGQWLGRRKDGSWVWLDVETQLLTNENGKPVGILGSACSIEPQKRVEKQLEESQARAKAILETTVDGIITINTKGIIQTVNKAVEKLFGYNREELIGENVHILMPSPHYERHDEYIQRYLETGEKKIIGIDREVRGKKKDGTTFPMELAVSEVTWDHETIFTGSIRDISDRRALENEILEITDEERRRIGQDLHDGLGQMLTGIALMSQNLARKMESNSIPGAEQVREITEMIKESDHYARTLSHSLIPVEFDSAGFKTALEQLCNRSQRLFDIRCDFVEEGIINIKNQNSAVHLYRIAQEAISNAVKHGKATEVQIKLKGLSNGILLTIIDNGIGFSNAANDNSSKGFGIDTMRYRMHISGGNFQISETDDGKTRIACTIHY